jgi:hypothetical protein
MRVIYAYLEAPLPLPLGLLGPLGAPLRSSPNRNSISLSVRPACRTASTGGGRIDRPPWRPSPFFSQQETLSVRPRSLYQKLALSIYTARRPAYLSIRPACRTGSTGGPYILRPPVLRAMSRFYRACHRSTGHVTVLRAISPFYGPYHRFTGHVTVLQAKRAAERALGFGPRPILVAGALPVDRPCRIWITGRMRTNRSRQLRGQQFRGMDGGQS